MANKNWSPGNGQALPTNTPIKVDPRFNTITSSNPSGYVPLDPTNTGPNSPYYAINNDGVVTFKFGPGPSTQPFQADVENTLNDFASRTLGASIKEGIDVRTSFQSKLQSNLEAQALQLGIRPTQTQPAPADPAAGAQGAPSQTPGSAAPGPNSENPNANIDPQALTGLGSQLENFDTTNTFGALKESFLKYPTSIDNGQDRIIITQIEYVPSGITADNTDINQITELLGNRDSQLQKSLGMVVLPMPNDISETNQTAWGESSLSSIAAALMNPAASAAQGLVNANPGETIDAVQRLGENLFSGQVKNRLNQFLTANAAASLIKLGGINVDPEAYLNRVTGVAINPNLELLFNGPKLRQFGFSFKMTPRSAEEARNIRSIVKFFKKGMAPRRSTVKEKSIYLGTPNVFKLKFMSAGEIGGIGRIKTCALVSCSVNYTPDGFYASYDGPNGPQPIATVMQLAFTELTPVYNDEYDAEGDGAENTIGPEGSEYKITGSSGNVEDQTQNSEEPNIPGGARAGTVRTPAGGGSSTKSQTIGTGQGGISKPVGGR